jgi:TonB family protein
MMKKNKSNQKSGIKIFLVLPFVFISFYFISCSVSKKVAENKAKSNKTVVMDNSIKPNSNMVYDTYAIDVKPEYPGGDAELMKFVVENTKYPKEAMEKGIQGIVYVRFVVNSTGKVENTIVMRSVDPILEEEAKRVILSMPDWKPGSKDGKPVGVYFIVPVQFKLQ